MSGIFGIINLDDAPVERAALARMSEVMMHRGPDGINIWSDAAVGLGHLMLCSTPESLHEKLPWKDPLSGYRITADARIDNRIDLIGALDIDKQSARDMPDSQLILATYRKWGEKCIDHLIGDFSFVIWHADSQQLFCARDHMGLRPFYYYYSQKMFVFASSARAVVCASSVPHQVNAGRVADFLVQELEGVNKTCSFFKHVYRMPPAHFGVLKRGEISFRQYWKPDPQTELQLGSDDEYASAMQEVLTEAIEARLRCHKPVASMLSGGVDSSTVVGICKGARGETYSSAFRTYSGVSDDESDCIESRHIRMMLDHGGLDPFITKPSDVSSYSGGFHRIAGIMEDPFDASWILLMQIYLSAHATGNAVVMDGIDGDGGGWIDTGLSFLFNSRGQRQKSKQRNSGTESALLS